MIFSNPPCIAKTLLLAIDVQNDFCPAYYDPATSENFPEGALAVKDGCEVVAPLNELAAAFARAGGRVAATQDWHPRGHISFASSHHGKKPGDSLADQVLWPDHCVQSGRGARFHAGFNLSPVSLIVRKGFRPNLDSYSAFFENDRETPTGLEGWIRGLGIETVIVGGLATDYCVFYSAMDSLRLGFETILVKDAVRGVGYPEGSVEKAIQEMRDAGVIFFDSARIIGDYC